MYEGPFDGGVDSSNMQELATLKAREGRNLPTWLERGRRPSPRASLIAVGIVAAIIVGTGWILTILGR